MAHNYDEELDHAQELFKLFHRLTWEDKISEPVIREAGKSALRTFWDGPEELKERAKNLFNAINTSYRKCFGKDFLD